MKTMMTTLAALLVAATITSADELNPLADMPWQTAAAGENTWATYPYQGFVTTAATEVGKPIGPGSLFASINWFQPLGNLNAGSSIEDTPIYMGLVWWDFQGGHHVMGELNSELPLRLSYIEITYGNPGPDHESWWQIPAQDGQLGLTQILPDPTIGGWVTHVNLYTRDLKVAALPDSGPTLFIFAIATLTLMTYGRTLHRAN